MQRGHVCLASSTATGTGTDSVHSTLSPVPRNGMHAGAGIPLALRHSCALRLCKPAGTPEGRRRAHTAPWSCIGSPNVDVFCSSISCRAQSCAGDAYLPDENVNAGMTLRLASTDSHTCERADPSWSIGMCCMVALLVPNNTAS